MSAGRGGVPGGGPSPRDRDVDDDARPRRGPHPAARRAAPRIGQTLMAAFGWASWARVF